MEPPHVAIGFFKNERRFLGYHPVHGKCVVVNSLAEATQFIGAREAALAALLMGVAFNLAHCRAVDVNEALNARPA